MDVIKLAMRWFDGFTLWLAFSQWSMWPTKHCYKLDRNAANPMGHFFYKVQVLSLEVFQNTTHRLLWLLEPDGCAHCGASGC
jgi:hypothetical protein